MTPTENALAASPERRERPDSASQVRLAVAAALARKADGVRVLKLAEISDFTDYFLICDGANDRQVQAIAEGVERALREHGVRPLHVEGIQNARWVLMDYGGDLLVHVFLGEARRFYDLERLWSDAPDLTAECLPDDAPKG